jgi:thiol-disulfide isomerase/thioredoxin
MSPFTINRRRLLSYFGLGIAGATAPLAKAALAQGDAPSPLIGKPLAEFQSIQSWLNTEPLNTKALKGNVVLIQFWTLGCINCQRTLPYLVQWHQRYANRGLKMIGVHTPEFAYERDLSNIQRALQRYKITYPVAVDNQLQTWKAYQNRYWPRLYLTDRQGIIRYDHIGEGAYETTEARIQKFLG